MQKLIDEEKYKAMEICLRKNGWVSIDLNFAKMTIEKRPFYCDRGCYYIKAFHKLKELDKCFIDEADGFPRYYFNFDCMIKELNSFMVCRKLEVIDILYEF